MRFTGVFLLVMGMVWVSPMAIAQQAPTDCAAGAPVLPAELEAWSHPISAGVMAAADASTVPVLPVGKAVPLTLLPQGAVHFVVAPGKAGEGERFAGMVALDVPEAGTYRVALGKAVWIDIVRDGLVVASTAHGHGPACSGIRKMVDFPLPSGRHLIQLAGAADTAITALVIRLP